MSGWWKPGDPAPIVAVAIGVNNEGSPHAGIVYRDDEKGEQLSLLHLRYHLLLTNNHFPASGTVGGIQYHLLIPKSPDSLLKPVAFRCRRIARVKPKIPWGFGSSQITFDTQGNMRVPPGSRGLNCATFVLRVFESVGFRLVDESAWQQRVEDAQRYIQLLNGLRVRIMEQHAGNLPVRTEQMAYVNRIANEIPTAIRVRPEEVAGACLSQTLPVNFADGQGYGCEVLNRILPPSPPPTNAPTPTPEATPQ